MGVPSAGTSLLVVWAGALVTLGLLPSCRYTGQILVQLEESLQFPGYAPNLLEGGALSWRGWLWGPGWWVVLGSREACWRAWRVLGQVKSCWLVGLGTKLLDTCPGE